MILLIQRICNLLLRFKIDNSHFLLVNLLLVTQFLGVAAQMEFSKSFFTPFNNNDGWYTFNGFNSNHRTNCPSADIFGGPGIFGYQTVITKTYQLPPHYKLAFQFKFWRLDPWHGSPYSLMVDDVRVFQDSPNLTTGTQICGSGTLGQVYSISEERLHNSISAIITIQSLQLSASWGISDFTILIFKCSKGCDSCDSNGDCLIWNRVLTYFSGSIIAISEGWKKDGFDFNDIYVCGSFPYYGQFLTTEQASVNLNLYAPHNKVRIQFKFFCAYITGAVQLQVTGNIALYSSNAPLAIIISTMTVCGSYLKLGQIQVEEFQSSSKTLSLSIQILSSSTVSTQTPYYGIRDFEVFTDAEKEIIQDDGIICDDKNFDAFDGCFSQTYDCIEGCSNCIKGQCISCESSWIFDQISLKCLPLCGDQIIAQLEECDDGNVQPYDGCQNCKFSCPLNCSICQFGQCLECQSEFQLIFNSCQLICNVEEDQHIINYETQKEIGSYCHLSNFLLKQYEQHIIINGAYYISASEEQCQVENYGIFAYYYQSCFYLKPQNCLIQFFDKCQTCIEEYELTNNLKCQSICNNGILQEQEFCDDSNQIQFDGCFECQSSCQLECLECYYSNCFLCVEGWKLIDFKCEQVCGDGIIALKSQEQCDDQNNESGDGCFDCRFECPYNCINCNANIQCLKCEDYFEVQNDKCIPICGDGIVVEGFEICDDGNDIQYDGCYQCQLSCQENCEICNREICLDDMHQCNLGFLFITNECTSICGDGIIVSNEQCDDTNDSPFDGCYQCQFSCPLNCQDCIEGICIECISGYQLINNYCQDKCGNGIKSNQEECDDGNHITLDGCTDLCQIEINWTCSQLELETSICLQIKPPHFNLKVLNQTFDIFYIQMSFTHQVKLLDKQQNLTKNINAYLLDIDPSTYVIDEIQILEPNYVNVQDIVYLFKIQMLQQQYNEIYFQVTLNTLLIDEYDFQVDNNLSQIHLRNPIVLSQTAKKISHNISSFNMIYLIALAVSSLLILLSGNPVECFEILDTLQYQSNLKYININFPENLNIYFESSEVVTIVPILEKLKFSTLFQNIFGIAQQDTFGKFLTYNINSDLIANLQGLLAQLGLTIILLILSKIYLKYALNNMFSQIRVFLYKNQRLKISQKFAYLIHKLNYICLGFQKIFSLNGFVYALQVNSWDLIFKSLLQIFSNKEINWRTYISNFFANTILIIFTVLILDLFSLKQSHQELNKLKNLQHEGLILIKKFLFLYVLIGFQNNPLLQCILIALINSFYIATIILGEIIQKNLDLIIIIVFELPVIIFSIISMAFDENFSNFLSPQTQVNLAFGQIGLLLFGSMAPLIKYVVQIKLKFTKFLKHLQEDKAQKRNAASSLFY